MMFREIVHQLKQQDINLQNNKIMKNIFKITLLLGFVIALQSCDSSDGLNDGRFDANPESGWVDFDVNVASTTIAPSATEVVIPIEINAPVNAEDLVVNFSLEPVAGGDPSQVVTSSNRNVTIPANQLSSEIVLTIGDIIPLISNGIIVEFDVVLNTTNRASISVGLADDSQITSFRISTPCPIGIMSGSMYTGTSVYVPAAFTAQDGYDATVTAVAGMDLTYDIDTVWGPNYVNAVCGGCVNDGDYPGPVRISIDPATFNVTVISGGEPSGQGYAFDIAYTITGSGTYDSCNNSFILDLFDADLFGEAVSVTLLAQ